VAVFAAVTVAAGAAAAVAPAALASPAAATRPGAAGRAATSSGTFSSVKFINPAADPGVLTAVGIGKITGSGRNDLVADAVNRDNVGGFTRIYVYPQQANGTLGKPVTYQNTDIDSGDSRITISDLYGTGHPDILLPENDHIDVVSYSGGKLTGTELNIEAQNLRVADFNGDGHPDLLTEYQGVARVYTGSAAHTFTLWRTVPFTTEGSGGDDGMIFAADFDHNGRFDIAFLNGNGFGVRRQTSLGVFAAQQNYQVAPIDGQTFPTASMVTGDVNGDGYADAIVSVNGSSPFSGIEVFAGGPSGTLKAPVVHPTLDNPGPMAVADLNGDGRSDVVATHVGWDNVGVLLQQSNGTLAAEALYPAGTDDWGPDQPAVGDLNNDGKPDIAFNSDNQIGLLYGK
jgi:hypothetical protein